MHGHRHGHRGYRGEHRGGLRFHRPFPNRQELLERLEAYQRDLEQEVVDIADLIAHLRDKSPQSQPQV
jgi:hypothetical protein